MIYILLYWLNDTKYNKIQSCIEFFMLLMYKKIE